MTPKIKEVSWPVGLPIVTLNEELNAHQEGEKIQGTDPNMASTSDILELSNMLPIAVQAVDAPDNRFQGFLMGRVTNDLLLINIQGKPSFSVGEKLIVRTIQEGKVMGFQTEVKASVAEPAELYFLSMPADIEVKSLRKNDRLDVFIPVELQMETNSNEPNSDTLLFKGTMLNISGGGSQVFVKRQVAAETLLTLTFNLPGERQPTSLAGRVLDTFTQSSLVGLRVMFFKNERNLQDLTDVRRWLDKNLIFAQL